MNRWSKLVQENALEIRVRFLFMGDSMASIAKELSILQSEAKELELALKFQPYFRNKLVDKLQKGLNVSDETALVWQTDFQRAVLANAWCNKHGDISSDVIALIDQFVGGRLDGNSSEALISLLGEQDRLTDQNLQAKRVPENAFAELKNEWAKYIEQKNSAKVGVLENIEILQDGLRYRGYELHMSYQKPCVEFVLTPDMNFEGFIAARCNTKNKTTVVRWKGGVFDLGLLTAEKMVKWLVDQFVQNVNDTVKFEKVVGLIRTNCKIRLTNLLS